MCFRDSPSLIFIFNNEFIGTFSGLNFFQINIMINKIAFGSTFLILIHEFGVQKFSFLNSTHVKRFFKVTFNNKSKQE